MTPTISPPPSGAVPSCARRPRKRRKINGSVLAVEQAKLRIGPFVWIEKRDVAERIEMDWCGSTRTTIWRYETELEKLGRCLDVTGQELLTVPELARARDYVEAHRDLKPAAVITIMLRHRSMPEEVKAWAKRRLDSLYSNPSPARSRPVLDPDSPEPCSTDAARPDSPRSTGAAPGATPVLHGGAAQALRPSYMSIQTSEANPSNSRVEWDWSWTRTDGFAPLSRGEEGKGLGGGILEGEAAPLPSPRPAITADADYHLLASLDGASDRPAAPAPQAEGSPPIPDRQRARTASRRATIVEGSPTAKQLADAGAFYLAGGLIRETWAIPVFKAAGIVGREAIEAFLADPASGEARPPAVTASPEPDPDYARLAALDGAGDKPAAIPRADAVPKGVVKFAGLEAVMDRAMGHPAPSLPSRANPPSRRPVATSPPNPESGGPPPRASRKATIAELSERAKGFDRALPALPSLAEAIRFAEDLCRCFGDGDPDKTIPLWAQDFRNPFPFGLFAEKIKQMDAPGIDSACKVLNAFIVAIRRKREASA